MKLVTDQNVMSIQIEPGTLADREKLEIGLDALASEGHSFSCDTGANGTTTLNGTDELHLDNMVDQLLNRFEVEAKIGAPCVIYHRAADGDQLEPIMKLEMVAPNGCAVLIKNDVRSRRGWITDQVSKDAVARLTAFVPLVNLFGFSNRFLSMTEGLGTFGMQFDHYAKCPSGTDPDGSSPFVSAKRA